MKTKTRMCNHPCCGEKCRRVPAPKKVRKRIPKVSKKEAKRRRKYRPHKEKTFADDNICAVALLENKTDEIIKLFKGCQYHATQFHHPAGRLGDHLYDEGVKLCGVCHDIVERKPALAKQLSLSKSRLINS